MTQDKDLQVLNTTLDNVLAPYLEQINKLSDLPVNANTKTLMNSAKNSHSFSAKSTGSSPKPSS